MQRQAVIPYFDCAWHSRGFIVTVYECVCTDAFARYALQNYDIISVNAVLCA